MYKLYEFTMPLTAGIDTNTSPLARGQLKSLRASKSLEILALVPLVPTLPLMYMYTQCTIFRRVLVACRGFKGVGHAEYSLQCGLRPHWLF